MKKSQNSTKEDEIKSRVYSYQSNLIDDGWVTILQRLHLELLTSVCNKIYTVGKLFRNRIWWWRFQVLKVDTFVLEIKIVVSCIFNGPTWQLNFTISYLEIQAIDLDKIYIMGNIRRWRSHMKIFTWLKKWLSFPDD
jgi:hypothetical protein